MFSALGKLIARTAPIVVVLWVVIVGSAGTLALTGYGGPGLFERLHSGEPRVAGSESDAGNALISQYEQYGERLSLVVSDVPDLEAEEVVATIAAFHSRTAAISGVAQIVDPFIFPQGITDPQARPMVSDTGFIAFVSLDKSLTGQEAATAHNEIVIEFERLAKDLQASAIASSEQIMVKEVTDQIQSDLQRGEAVALPISLLIMIIVFGGFLAASMPLVGAIASILGGLGALLGFSYLLDLDAVVVNVVTVLGLGLSIDYGLLIVSRYREELRGSIATDTGSTSVRPYRDPVIINAITKTVATAGRTVAFSAVTVAISVAGLMLFNLEILQSLGAAGVSVVVIALASALTLVPALLTLLGRRMARPSILRKVPGLHAGLEKFGDIPPKVGVFSRMATRMQRRPWLAVLGSLLILGVLASPIANLQMRNSTTELLPQTSPQQEFLRVLESDFPVFSMAAMSIVTEEGKATEFARELRQIDGVKEVDPAAEIGHGWVRLGVRITAEDPGGPKATEIVEEIRELHADGPQFWVVGQAPNQVDFTGALKQGMPQAVAVVVLATLILLFLMTGSVLVPLKALAINVASLGASLGVTSWIFGEGHLTSLLNFTSAGGLESYVVAVVIAFGFGLAMDYEVFLIARMKEIHDEGASNNTAVRDGLQRTGRIITSAALVIIVVFAGFIAGDLLAIKQVGVALAVTVAIDATLVRMILVPATMTLLGEWNWWAPKPLRKLHESIGVSS